LYSPSSLTLPLLSGLVEAQDEIAESRKKFKLMGHQIEQLKEEIAAKDQVQ
jgi:hypothetical protein